MQATPHPDLDPSDVFDGGSQYCPVCGDAASVLFDRCPADGSALARCQVTGDPLIGRLLDRQFRVVSVLAQGAMGTVYEGVQRQSVRRVAIKVIRAELGQDDAVTQRFLRESLLLTRVDHPNVVEVLDYGETSDGCLYLVMEHLRGKTLDVALATSGAFSVRRTCEIGLQLCNALVAAHAHGVVHRDLKPANILLLAEHDDRVKVLDFGLAKSFGHDAASEITITGALLGTPLYMAPETITANLADPRSDLYALGCVLHELLTGVPAFCGESTALVLMRQLDDVPPPLPEYVPENVRHLVQTLLAKVPDARPASAIAVGAMLEHCLTTELGADPPTLVESALPDLE